jgi:hypothetical protein
VEHGEYVVDGKRHQLIWGDWRNAGTAEKPDWRQFTVNDTAADPEAELVTVGAGTCTGDAGYAPDGHFHPNKPPGCSLLAVPAYTIIYHTERLLGLDPDDWWTLSLNLWLTSVFSVGLASALGVVVFLRLCGDCFPSHPRASLAAATVLAFGTTYFPFATLLFDHNLTAALLLSSFTALRRERSFLGGVCAGIGALTNYLAAIPGAMFGLYSLWKYGRWNWKAALCFSAGVLPCAAALLAYNYAAFGSLFTLNTSFQNPAFKEVAPAFLGMFTAPSWFAAVVISVTPWRGLLWLSPVLLLVFPVFFGWMRGRVFRAERWLIAGITGFFFLVNICFNGFHGGFAAGPRYLIPALPFLCLALVPAFVRWRGIALVLGGVSLVQQSLLTITDAQNPLAVGSHAWVDRPGEWIDKLYNYSLVGDYAWPLFKDGRAWPMIERKFEQHVEGVAAKLEKTEPDAVERAKKLKVARAEAWERVRQGEPEPLWLAAVAGPVSVNPMGPWDGTYFQTYAANSTYTRWASFNVGEFWWPEQRMSVAPLGGLFVLGVLLAFVWSRREPEPEYAGQGYRNVKD